MIGSDIYIMIPITLKKNGKVESINFDGDVDCNEFYSELDKQIKYACKKTVKNPIDRTNCLGGFNLKYYDTDKYEAGENNAKLVDCNVYLRTNDATKLSILEIIIKQFEDEDSFIGGTVLGYHAQLKSEHFYNGNEIYLEDFVDILGYSIVGDYRILYQNKFVDNNNELKYLLYGEMKSREKDSFNISDDTFKGKFEDIVDYDEFNFFASDKAIITLIKDFKNNFKNNIKLETMSFYIVEFSILQNAAISRMNSSIVKALEKHGELILKDSLDIIQEFGKTILLWDRNIYKYYFDQKAADELYKAFKTDKLWDEYKRNKSHIDQLTTIKSSINGKRESFILGAISFLFTLINLYELIISFKEKSMTPNSLTLSFAIIYLVWVVYLLHKNRT